MGEACPIKGSLMVFLPSRVPLRDLVFINMLAIQGKEGNDGAYW